MAAAAGAASGSCSVGEEFTARELEVAAILADMPSIHLARGKQRRRSRSKRQRPEILATWGMRRRRTRPGGHLVEKPEAIAADRGEGADSPDTPLEYHNEEGDDEDEDLAAAKKARTQEEWVQEQRGVVACLSQENADLYKQIEEYRARLQSSTSTNATLKQMHSQRKQQQQEQLHRRQQEYDLRQRLQARAASMDRPALVLGLDLNEPTAAADAEEAKAHSMAPQWSYLGQLQPAVAHHKAALTSAARRRRREIRRAKAGAGKMRRPG